jgi:hypothetical protein
MEHWYGRRPAGLTVRVLDAKTGRPLADAWVRLFESGGIPDEGTAGKTDANGLTRLAHVFTAAGATSPVCETGTLYLSCETLAVEARGYEEVCEPLRTYTGPRRSVYGPSLPVVEVHLHKK